MNKRATCRSFILSIIIVLLLLSMAFIWSSETSARPLGLQQTWPSRTPTSPSNPPTNTPSGGQSTSQPPGDGTAEPPDGEDPPTPETGVTPVIIVPTPIGGYQPTTEPCGLPPTVLSLAGVNVREGPGLDYDVISVLIYLEVRPIVGRAADAAWWLIELPNEVNGWVFDQAVVINGYTANIPIISSPDIDGVTPTPGTPWQPTPNPICTPLPTSTSSPTSEPLPTGQSANTVLATSTATAEPPAATNTPEPTPVPPTVTETPAPSNTPEPTPVSESVDSTAISASPTEESETPDEEGSSGVSWMLIGGVGLVVAGLIIGLLRRRGS